jgi:hypothetical protein
VETLKPVRTSFIAALSPPSASAFPIPVTFVQTCLSPVIKYPR